MSLPAIPNLSTSCSRVDSPTLLLQLYPKGRTVGTHGGSQSKPMHCVEEKQFLPDGNRTTAAQSHVQ
jgi:hypothetical protein